METLKIIADSPSLQEALKKLLLAEFEPSPLELGFSNERLGERERARMVGKEAVERVFLEINKHKTQIPRVEGINRAR